MNYLSKVFPGALMLILIAVSVQAGPGDEEKDVPIDPQVKKGQLENGLTYYIRHNEVPENRAEFYLFVNAGAVLEEPEQNGLAHFCEHMAFNGTKNFPDKGVLDYMESIGVKFGHNVNAFTSYDMTVYNLAQVPVDRETTIDSSLLVLHDWANEVSFKNEEIDKERGVIHEEWRTRRSPQFRMRIQNNKVLFKGSKYAEHDIIGEKKVIDSCDYETLRSFYNDWYRPGLQAVAIVGDVEVDKVEQKIRNKFGDIQPPEDPKERYVEDIPDNEEPLVSVATDPEATNSQVKVVYKHDALDKDDLTYLKNSFKHQLYSKMLNDRLSELTQKENPPFVNGFTYYGNLVRSTDAYQSIAMAKNEQIDRALETLLTENKRVKEFGFTPTELKRSKEELLSDLEKQYKNRSKKKSKNYIWSYMSNFMQGKPIPGIEYKYDLAKKELPEISLEEINKMAHEWITDKNMVVTISAAEKEGAEVPQEQDVKDIIRQVENKEIEAYKDEINEDPLISDLPESGTVEKRNTDEQLGVTEFNLGNGMQVMIKPTDFKENEVLMKAYSLGGNSLYADKGMYPSGRLYSTVMRYNGVGEFGRTALKKKLSGKNVSVNPFLNDWREGLNGNCESDDFETMLKLTHLYFQPAREDETAFSAIMNRYNAILGNKSADPRYVFNDSIQYVMSGHNPLKEPLSVEMLDKVSYEDILEIHNERFANPGDFKVILVGNIDPEEAKPLIEKYLGSIEGEPTDEKWKPLDFNPPKGEYKTMIEREMNVPKGSVFVNFNGPIAYDYENRIKMKTIAHILELRYTETIREEQGGSYGVRVRHSVDEYPENRFSLSIVFDCDPENVEKLKGIVYDEVEKLYQEGPKKEDVKKAREYFLKMREENLEENSYWLSSLVHNEFHEENIFIKENYEAIVKGLTTEDIKEASAKYLKEANNVEIIMKPKGDQSSE
ncbi:MAG: insulinase family protein [Bacteroidales bacterium]|nr:insulinase family protein [Bacteroidales bacterium]MCF8333627.1 insulinase family protein [Bacteroidales bacterium]